MQFHLEVILGWHLFHGAFLRFVTRLASRIAAKAALLPYTAFSAPSATLNVSSFTPTRVIFVSYRAKAGLSIPAALGLLNRVI
jgi:hypothetical protein